MPNSTEDWKPISAAELVKTPVERLTAELTMADFQRFMTEMLDGWFWDRLSDEELLDKLEGYARTYNKKVTREQFQNLINARRQAHENSGIELPMPAMPEREALPPYIVPRRDKNYAGWFPRGTVSLIAGSSGMGKTTLLLYLLEDLRAGRSILNHPAAKADYRLGLVDRTVKQLAESLEDKGLEEQEVLARSVQIHHSDGSAPKVLARQLRQWKRESNQQPDIVVLEGIDFWVRKINDFDAVYSFIKSLEPVAEDWNIAIVASAGSPKMKAKDGYTLTRDNILGTSAWGRTCSTIMFLQLINTEDGNSARKVTILPRTGRDEHMYFRFEDGRAIFSDVPPSERLANLNVHADVRKGVEDVDRMRAVVVSLAPGTHIPLTLFPFVGKNATRTLGMRTLATDGLVEKKGQQWFRK